MAYASSYPSTSTLAPAYGNFATFSRVDVESLLWEMSHIVRGLTKVTRSQQAQLAKLREDDTTTTNDDAIITEYEERASAAVRAVDTALDQMAADVLVQEDDAWYDVDRQGVAAWALETHQELHRADDEEQQQQPPVEIPADFWETHEFNWDDEPEELEPLAPAAPAEPLFVVDEDLPLDEAADELVLPSDSVTSRGDSDSEYADDDEWEGYSDASFEAGEREHFALQQHQQQQQQPAIEYDDHEDDDDEVPIETAAPMMSVPVPDADSAMRALRRHSWLGVGVGGGHAPAAAAAAVSTRFDSAAALLGKLFQQTTHVSAMPLTAF